MKFPLFTLVLFFLLLNCCFGLLSRLFSREKELQIETKTVVPNKTIQWFIDTCVIPRQGSEKMFQNPNIMYKLDRLISKTVWGYVYEASERIAKTKVVVKISLWEILLEDECDTMIEDPFTAVRLQRMIPDHVNIAKLYSVGYDDKGHWTIMEFCKGLNVEVFAEKNYINENLALEISKQMLAAVHHMHEYHVTHLDASLNNFIVGRSALTGKFIVKAIDFGQAREIKYRIIAGAKSEVPFLRSRVTKPCFRAPEIWLSEKFYGTKADIFALGLGFFNLFSNHYRLHHQFFHFLDASWNFDPVLYSTFLQSRQRGAKINEIRSVKIRKLVFQMLVEQERRISMDSIIPELDY